MLKANVIGSVVGDVVLVTDEEKEVYDASFFCEYFGLTTLDACFHQCEDYYHCKRVSKIENLIKENKNKE